MKAGRCGRAERHTPGRTQRGPGWRRSTAGSSCGVLPPSSQPQNRCCRVQGSGSRANPSLGFKVLLRCFGRELRVDDDIPACCPPTPQPLVWPRAKDAPPNSIPTFAWVTPCPWHWVGRHCEGCCPSQPTPEPCLQPTPKISSPAKPSTLFAGPLSQPQNRVCKVQAPGPTPA